MVACVFLSTLKLLSLAPHRVHTQGGTHVSAHPRKDVGLCADIQHMCAAVLLFWELRNCIGNRIAAAVIAKDLALGEGGKAQISFNMFFFV